MAKLSALEIDVIVAAENALANLRKLNDGLGETENETKKAGEGAKKMGDSFAASAIGIGAVTAAMAGVISAGREFVGLAQKQELAEIKLANAMSRRGDVTGEGTERLKAQASALQELTGIGDEQTIQAQAMLATFNLNAEAIENLIPSVLDMAAATQQATGQTADLQATAMQLGKAITDSPATLKRYGIAMSDAEEEALKLAEGQEKAALLAQIVQNNFGGTAETIGGAGAGAFQKASAAIGDLQENIGFIIQDAILPLVNIVKSAVDWFKQITDRSSALSGVLKTLVQVALPIVGIIAAITAGMGVYLAVTALAAAANTSLAATFTALWTAATGPIGLVIGAIVAIGAAMVALYKNVEPVRKILDQVWDGIVQAWDIVSPIFAMLGDVISEIGGLVWELLVTPFEAVWEVLTTVIGVVWDTVKALFGLTDAGGGSVDIMGLLQKAVAFVQKGLLGLKGTIGGVRAAFAELKNVIGEFWDALTSLRFDKLGEILSGAADRMKTAYQKGFVETVNAQKETQDEQKQSAKQHQSAMTSVTTKGAKKRADELYKIAQDALKRQQDLELAQLDFIDALESEKLRVRMEYLQRAIELAKQHKQDTTDLLHQQALIEIQIEKKTTEELRKNVEARIAIRKQIDEYRVQAAIERSNEEQAALIESEQRLENELAMLEEWRKSEELTEQEYELLREQMRSAHLDRIAEIEAKARDEREKADKEAAEKQIAIEQSKRDTILSGVSGMFGDLAAASKEQFELSKAFRTAEGLVNTYSSAIKAYESLAAFPPLAIAAAAAATAAGLANVARIQAQDPPGYRSGGYTGDMPVNQAAGVVHGQVFVMNAPATARNRAALEAMNAGATASEAFGVDAPGAPEFGGGGVAVNLNGEFVMRGNDLVLVAANTIMKQRTGTY